MEAVLNVFFIGSCGALSLWLIQRTFTAMRRIKRENNLHKHKIDTVLHQWHYFYQDRHSDWTRETQKIQTLNKRIQELEETVKQCIIG